jgi:hypothetical protein
MRYFDLPSKARRAYDKIVAEHILELRAGEEVPLAHTLQRLTALSQIATGYTRTTSNDGARLVEWLHDEKVLIARDEARDIIESGKKVIIFYRNTPEGEAIRKALEEYRPLRLDGHVRDRDRHAAIEAFHNDDDRRLIVCQEQVASLTTRFSSRPQTTTTFTNRRSIATSNNRTAPRRSTSRRCTFLRETLLISFA